MRVVKLKVVILVLCIITSCQILGPDSEELEPVAQITTGNQKYELTDSTLIDLSIKNISSSPIYYNICDSRTIEEIENEKVTKSVIFTNPCKCNCVVTLQPDEFKKLYITGYFIVQHEDKLKLTEGVKYKILPHFYKDKKQEEQISLRAINASQFTITQ